MEQVFKVYNDGSHFVGTKFIRKSFNISDDGSIVNENGELNLKEPLKKFKEYRSDEFISENFISNHNKSSDTYSMFNKFFKDYFNGEIKDLETLKIKIKYFCISNIQRYEDLSYKPLLTDIERYQIVRIFERVLGRIDSFIKFRLNALYRPFLKHLEEKSIKEVVNQFSIGELDENEFKNKLSNVVLPFDDLDEIRKIYQKKRRKSIRERIKRFKQKAYSNKWNYFVTFTYDDSKISESDFKEKLKSKLSHLHTRKNWKYMGVFEKSSKGRLHFHGLLYVPNGSMVGEVVSISDYSTEHHKRQTRYQNTEFFDKFGINDFKPLIASELNKTNVLDYITKYINKTDEKIFYSRDIILYQYLVIDENKSLACNFIDEVLKRYVFFDDLLESSIPINIKRLQI